MYIGIDIGGTKCAVILGDESLNIIKKVKFDTTTRVPACGVSPPI